MQRDRQRRDLSDGVYWLETCGESLSPRPHLAGDFESDVAIVGGGYSGLWTAYYLLVHRPDLRVAVLEARVCGWGASGRNGGGCGGRFSNEGPLLKGLGASQRLELLAEQEATVREVDEVLRSEGISAEFAVTGSLVVAEGPHQLQALARREAAASEAERRLGARRLSRAELEDRVSIHSAEGAWLDPTKGIVHPGKLVRGLARAVERRGGVIFEETRVSKVRSGVEPALVTRNGTVRAREVVVAVEGYSGQLPGFKRARVPIVSSIVLTEPLPGSVWDRIRWQNREAVSSFRLSVNYARRTADNRILFGGRGAPYRIASAVGPTHNETPHIYSELRERACRWWPLLKDVRFTHEWSGVLGVPRDLTPSVKYNSSSHILTLGGYVGSGVGASNLLGRAAADVLLARETRLVRLPFVNHTSRPWESEPFRWLGIRYVQRGLLSADRRSERSGRAASGRTLAERLWKT